MVDLRDETPIYKYSNDKFKKKWCHWHKQHKLELFVMHYDPNMSSSCSESCTQSTEQLGGYNLRYHMLAVAYSSQNHQIYVSVCVCQAIQCQVSDRFLFVHKLYPVISSIFETIKQWRENGWPGNPWILICQHNEIECGKVMEVCTVGSELGTNFYFRFLLGCSYSLPSQVDMMRTTYWQRFVIAANLDTTPREMPVVEASFQVNLSPEKIQGLQTDFVMIAAPDEGCFSISGDQAYALYMPVDILHVKNTKGKIWSVNHKEF